MNAQIERGVEIPVSGFRRPRTEYGELACKMGVGESAFFADYKSAEKLRSALWNNKRKPVIRKMDGGWRVWRIE